MNRGSETEVRQDGRRAVVALLGAPVAWAVGFTAAYALVSPSCLASTRLPLHVVTAATLVSTIAAGLLAHRECRRAEAVEPDGGGSVRARTRFLSAVGMLSGALFSLAVIAQWMAVVILDPCMTV